MTLAVAVPAVPSVKVPEPEIPVHRAAGNHLGSWSLQAQRVKLEQTVRSRDESFTFGIIGDAEPGRFPWQRILPPRSTAFVEQMRALQERNPDLIV